MTTKTRRATAKDGGIAMSMLAADKRADATEAARPFTAVDLRKCIGSARIGVAAHEAPPADFPAQPSQKDGLGRMCQTHWKEYVRGLARDAKARKDDPLDLGARIAHDLPATSLGEAWDNAQTARAVLAEDAVPAPGWDETLAAQARVATKRAAAKVAFDAGVVEASAPRETPAVTARRAKLEAKIAAVGIASDEGQALLEGAGKAAARGRKPMAEAAVDQKGG